MKKLFCIALCLILAMGMFAACGNGGESNGSGSGPASSGSGSGSSEGAGGTGSTYRQLYSQELTTLDYLVTTNANEFKIIANVVDCLVEYDKYGVLKPALAESWDHNDDYTVWTFNIRQGVKWVDKDGNEVADVTAHDWVSGAAYVNDAHANSGLQYMFDGIVKNAQDYFEQTAEQLEAENAVIEGTVATVEEYYAANGIDTSAWITFDEVGVKAIDDYTLEYTMETPCPYFISVLSYASYMPVYGPFLEEQGEFFGIDNETILYNGAYLFSDYEPQVRRVLTKNPTYWDPDNVFIERLEWIYNSQDLTLAPTMFQRGEVDLAKIGADILEEWMNNEETKNLVRPSVPEINYSYFFSFNFEPRFDDVYEPDNWIKAVNNENFRQSLRAGLDRIKALAVQDPYAPENLMSNSVTPVNFATANGKDFTDFGPIAPYTNGDSYDPEAALAYKEAAIAELTAAGATFPIKIPMLYNPATPNWDKQCQVVEQQLEELLGTDYIDIIVEAGPSTGFLSEIRRSGKYAFMKCNYGADFADPQTWTDPFNRTNTFNFFYTDETKVMSDIPATNKTPETQALVDEYYRLVDAAKAITIDQDARFEAFATAEAFLLEHAFIIPFSVDFDEGYVADYRNPFDVAFAPFGVAPHTYKGRQLLDEPMGMDEYQQAKETWEQERAAALAAA